MSVHATRSRLASAAALALLAAPLAPAPADACTTAVVAPSASRSGRPMLWKNRDADGSDNQVVFLADGRYPYVGVVNRGDAAGLQVWAGINSAGFGVMNSASYNLESGDTAAEGTFMKLALQSCATVDEFEALLVRSNAGGRDVSANFGVIDAKGGAAVFETSAKGYVRVDAAPSSDGGRGLLVRSNYSRSGAKESGTGFLREARAIELLGPAAAGGLDLAAILRAARDVANAGIGQTGEEAGPALVYTGDSVCRLDTVSAIVLEAPAPGEGPEAAALWIVPSLPLAGAAVPVFPLAGVVPAALAADRGPAPLAASALELRKRLYPDARGEKKRYMDRRVLAAVKARALPGLLAAEEATRAEVEAARGAWRRSRPAPADAAKLSASAAERALAAGEAAVAAVAKELGAP
ncbi:MAG TPA: hypothetical protein P5164_13170 [Thermoanaerobaculia bacterium]|nr:hypothetical protein [Thermoanaerobaculia bacterium]